MIAADAWSLEVYLGDAPVATAASVESGGAGASGGSVRRAADPLEAFVLLLLHERSRRLAVERGRGGQGRARLWLPPEGAPPRLLEALAAYLPEVVVSGGHSAPHAAGPAADSAAEPTARELRPEPSAVPFPPDGRRAELTPGELAMLLAPMEEA